MKKTILVTGGAGFIGSALIQRLRLDGHTVVCVDSINEYYDPSLKESRLKLFDNQVSIHRIDIAHKKALSEIFSKYQFDTVCHLAAQAGVRYSITNPEVYVHSNITGLFSVLECMKDHGVKKLVFASSSSVYGESEEVPFSESQSADQPVSLYAATKRSGELMAHAYHKIHGLNVTALRFFTVYGPYGRPDMAPMIFTEKILKGEPIDVYNNGNMRRDFTYIDDIVEGFIQAVNKPFEYEVINLGNGSPVQLLDFIETLEDLIGKKAEKNMLPMQLGDVPQTYAKTSKAEKLLGFRAKTDIKKGLGEFLSWYKEYYQ
ncbi:MAG: SDR family NAD(P)-dependent oxidoreductase [Candidatus Paceibacterota bacterium]